MADVASVILQIASSIAALRKLPHLFHRLRNSGDDYQNLLQRLGSEAIEMQRLCSQADDEQHRDIIEELVPRILTEFTKAKKNVKTSETPDSGLSVQTLEGESILRQARQLHTDFQEFIRAAAAHRSQKDKIMWFIHRRHNFISSIERIRTNVKYFERQLRAEHQNAHMQWPNSVRADDAHSYTPRITNYVQNISFSPDARDSVNETIIENNTMSGWNNRCEDKIRGAAASQAYRSTIRYNRSKGINNFFRIERDSRI